MAKSSFTTQKHKAKPTITTPKPTSKPTKIPKATVISSKPPAPYTTPPPVFQPFLQGLNPKHIYIVHIDTHQWTFKRKIFAVPVLMNVVIAILLIWRARVALPLYAAILLATLGYESTAKVDYRHLDWIPLLSVGGRRALMFLVDWLLAVYIVPWPLDFFLESPANPALWRWRIGFQDQEIVVRKSRKWDGELPRDWLAEEADPAVYEQKIMPAIDRKYLDTKTGYLLMDKNWNLDFTGMIAAHALVKQGKASFSDFRKTVIVYSEDHGWLVWQVWKLDEGSQEEGRRKIVLFKDKLTAMGKENLFFKWIELIQYETSQPGRFTEERQTGTMRKAKALFDSEGVDFDKFWDEVGGVQGLPGVSPPSS